MQGGAGSEFDAVPLTSPLPRGMPTDRPSSAGPPSGGPAQSAFYL